MELVTMVREGLETNKQLESYQFNLSRKSQVLKEEIIQAFLFDLRDYINAVKILEDVADVQQDTSLLAIDGTDVSIILGEHAQLFQDIRKILAEREETSGKIRRQIAGLDGIIELNRLMLADNRQFQQVLKSSRESFGEIETEEKNKVGFLQRLFTRK